MKMENQLQVWKLNQVTLITAPMPLNRWCIGDFEGIDAIVCYECMIPALFDPERNLLKDPSKFKLYWCLKNIYLNFFQLH